MSLFKNKISDNLVDKLNEIVEDFSTQMKNYKSIDTKMGNRDELSNNLIMTTFLTGMATIPTGMMLGKLYLENIAAGGALGAILPVGLAAGAGVLSYLNYKAKENLENDNIIEKTMKSKHNEKHGNDFLKKLEDLDIGDTFNKIKTIIEDSVKNPPSHQSNVLKEVKKTLKNDSLK